MNKQRPVPLIAATAALCSARMCEMHQQTGDYFCYLSKCATLQWKLAKFRQGVQMVKVKSIG